MCGVYYLLDGLLVIYVGSSLDILRRIAEHRRNIIFDFYSYDECAESERFEKEAEAIKIFRPILNENKVLTP